MCPPPIPTTPQLPHKSRTKESQIQDLEQNTSQCSKIPHKQVIPIFPKYTLSPSPITTYRPKTIQPFTLSTKCLNRRMVLLQLNPTTIDLNVRLLNPNRWRITLCNKKSVIRNLLKQCKAHLAHTTHI